MNSATNDSIDLTLFDVREIPCRIKHGQIFQRWAELPVGAHFVLINDHDPVPLYYQFAAQFPDAFLWEYLPPEGDEFRVKITRVLATSTPAMTPPAAPARAGTSTPLVSSNDASLLELDVRSLEPPEPMVRILCALEELAPQQTLRARTDRRPLHLLPELEARGVQFSCDVQPDGSWITLLTRR